MKKYYLLVLVLFLSIFLTGCNGETTLRCTNTLKSHFTNVKEENIEVKLVFKDKGETSVRAEKTITATLSSNKLSEKNKKAAEKSLKQNYCNSELKDGYKCEAEIKGDKVIIKESGTVKQLMGEIKDYPMDRYKKIMKDKNYTCTEK